MSQFWKLVLIAFHENEDGAGYRNNVITFFCHKNDIPQWYKPPVSNEHLILINAAEIIRNLTII